MKTKPIKSKIKVLTKLDLIKVKGGDTLGGYIKDLENDMEIVRNKRQEYQP